MAKSRKNDIPEATPELTVEEPIVAEVATAEPVMEEPVVLDNPIAEKGIMEMKPEDMEVRTSKKEIVKKIDTSDPNVLCRVIKKHSCVIAKQHYDLLPDRDVTLPNSVATILQQAGVLIKK